MPRVKGPTSSDDRPQPASDLPPVGRLEVICGPMFAGKTTLLLERLAAARHAGSRVVAVKPSLDNRYHPTDITSHTGAATPAVTVDRPEELTAIDADVIGLDEAHFFEAGLHGAIMALLARGSRVILAGLDRTSLNEPFGEMGALLIEADHVEKLTAPCAHCGRPAVHTVRLFPSRERIVVGGVGMFENRCRVHLDAPPAPKT
jgi:thymidine kinase